MTKNVKLLLFGFVFLVVLIITYSNHFNNGFYFDDSHAIVNNESIRDIKNIPLFFTDGTTASSLPANQAYRPFFTLLNAIDYWIGNGLIPFYFHLSIFFWYVVLGILLFFLFQKLLNLSFNHKWNSIIALFATAWYMLHTANAETINYISGRAASFSALCIVASFLLYKISRTRKLYLYLLTMIIGIYTKETGAMFAPLLFFYILLFEEKMSLTELFALKNIKGLLNTIKKFLPAFIVTVILVLINLFYLTPEGKIMNTAVSRFDYFTTQFFVILHYLGNFILPTDLCADPDFKIIYSILDKRVLLGLVVIILLLIVAFKTSVNKKTRPIAFGILWFFIALLPTSSFVPLFETARDIRTFFPYIGIILSVSWYIALFAIKHESIIQKKILYRSGTPALLIIIISAYAYGANQRNKVWNTGESLWYDVVIKSPEKGRGLMNYSTTQMAKGKYDIALEYYERALKTNPYYSTLHVNLGILKNAMGYPDEAEKYFKNALSYDENNPEAYYYYGKWLYENKKINKAQDLLKKGQKLSHGHSRINNLINKINLEEFYTPQEKIEQLINTVQKEPTPGNYLELSLTYYEAEMYHKCIEACEKALTVKPDYAAAYNNICSAYNMLGKWAKAIEACEKSLQINPDYKLAKGNLNKARAVFDSEKNIQKNPSPENYLNLSLTYYKNGLYEKCIRACEEALKLKPDYAEAYNNICSAYNMLEKWDEAITACEKSLQVKPDFERAKNNFKRAQDGKLKQAPKK
ncbi:MAG: tetratricopeptide repeat protein [Bacteroidota bacterium]